MHEATHSSETRYRRLGVLLAGGGTLLFSLKSIFIKLAFSGGAEPTQILWVRLMLSAPFYVGVLYFLYRTDAGRTDEAGHSPSGNLSVASKAMALGFLGYYLASYLDLAGLQFVSAQLERLTLFVYPTMIAILAAIFLGEQLNARVLAAIAICYAGIVMMYSSEARLTSESHLLVGVILVLASALCYAIYVVLAKPLIKQLGSLRFTCWAMLGSALCISIHFAVAGGEWSELRSPGLWLYGFLIAFVCTVLPSFCISEAIARLGATRTSIIGTLGPVITMGLSVCILGEPSSIWHVLGMLTVLVGVLLVSKQKAAGIVRDKAG